MQLQLVHFGRNNIKRRVILYLLSRHLLSWVIKQLRGHEPWSAHRVVADSQSLSGGQLTYTVISQFDPDIARLTNSDLTSVQRGREMPDKDIGRLDVQVYHLMAMEILQSFGNLTVTQSMISGK